MDRSVVVLFLALLTGCNSTPLTWEALTVPSLLRSRWYAGSVFYDDRLYIFGGESNRAGANDTGILGKSARNREM